MPRLDYMFENCTHDVQLLIVTGWLPLLDPSSVAQKLNAQCAGSSHGFAVLLTHKLASLGNSHPENTYKSNKKECP